MSDEEKSNFDKQMQYIISRSKAVRLSELIGKLPSKNNESRVAITFDDAFENLIDNAIPCLVNCRIPATIFVPVAYVGTYPRWDMSKECRERNEKIMSREQLINLKNMGFNIQSHTLTHPRLAEINASQIRDELYQSKLHLESILNSPIDMISYPHGSCNEEIPLLARESGYRFGFTIEPECLADLYDPFMIPRISISPRDSLLVLRLKMSGAYGYSRLVRKFKNIIKRCSKKKQIG